MDNNTDKLNELLKKVDEGTEADAPSQNIPTLTESDEVLDIGNSIDLDDFQVVRREFFAHLREPAASFNDYKFYVNAACLSKFGNSQYAQILINQKNKILALRPCEENAKDSFMWCSESKGKRKPRPITCTLFFAKVVSMMDWNPKYRYKLLGKLIHANGENLIAFDLTATEVYKKTFVEGEKPKVSRTPVYPSDWQNQFGLPFNEHKQSMQINIFDGYAIYSIKEPEKPANSTQNDGSDDIKSEEVNYESNTDNGNHD